MQTRDRLVLALDVDDLVVALRLAKRLQPYFATAKVGLELFSASGPDAVSAVADLGYDVFLDLKLHDIPNTVAHAVRSAAALGVELLTLHASGGAAMMRAARAAAGEGGPALLAVTVLTSLSAEETAEAWGRGTVTAEAEVERLARLAHACGMDGVVASVHELAAIRRALPREFRVLTPGIRLAGDDAGDQSRVATPAEAVRLGADYLVIGRSVTAAADPAAAMRAVLHDVRAAAPLTIDP